MNAAMLALTLWVLVLSGVAWGVVVELAQGRLRGAPQDGYVSYYGIPYANITGLEGRYKIAGLAPSWSGLRYMQHSSSCPSGQSVEQCLWLDVHVPVGAGPWPVMVWVPGGGGPYNPRLLVSEGIILVHVNYRSGPLGFLCANDERIPGNAGTKDVVLALRWVRDNIVAFRGSPSQVTVAGQSFGAAVVEGLTLSPMAEGLFRGAIMQSGSILAPWVFNYNSDERVFKLAKLFTRSRNTDEIVASLLTADPGDIVDKSKALNVPYIPFGICVEKAFKNEETFLGESPAVKLDNQRVSRLPLMIGYNSNEAYIFAKFLRQSQVLRRASRDLSLLIPEELVVANDEDRKRLVRQIRHIYFTNNLTMAALLSYYSDVFFKSHIYRSAVLHSRAHGGSVYMYKFSHSGAAGVESVAGLLKQGAAHTDELAHLFPDKGRALLGDDGDVQRKIVLLWTSFVKYLNPTPSTESIKWESLNPGEPKIYVIGKGAEMTSVADIRAMQFWEETFDRYYHARQTLR